MALDPVRNFAKSFLATGIDSSITTIVLNAGDGAKFPDPATLGAYNLTIWDRSAYSDPADDPNREIVRVTVRSTDTLTATRGQEGTTGVAHNTSGHSYGILLGLTALQIANILATFAVLLGVTGGQTLIGGTAVTDILKLQGTAGNGTLTSAAIQALVGNAGATIAFTVLNNGNVGIGTTTPAYKLEVVGSTKASSYGIFGTGLTVVGNGNMALYQADYNNGYIGFPSVGNIALMNGNVGIGTTSPTNLLSLGGNAARKFWMERHTTANTAGNSLTVQAGGATAGATDKDGGMNVLSPGVSTGIGKSSVRTQRLGRAASTATADNALYDAIMVASELNLVDGVATSLFEIALPTLAMAGGTIEYSIIATDGTDMQSISGFVAFSAVNKGAVYTTQITENASNQAKAVSVGTLTGAWSILNETDKVTIQLNADTSLTPTSFKLYYKVHNGSRQAVTQL